MRYSMTFYSYSKVVKLAFENDENHRKSGYLDSRIFITSMTANSRRPYVFFKKEGIFGSSIKFPFRNFAPNLVSDGLEY